MPESTHASRRGSRALVLVACVWFLAACSTGHTGSNAGAAPRVASLETTKAPVNATATTDPNARRPLIRFDSTTAERRRLVMVWWTCLVNNGVPRLGNDAGWKPADDGTSPKYRAAGAACLPQQPEDYKEREKRTDPTVFDDHVRAMVSCLTAHGLHVKLSDDRIRGWKWTSDTHALAEMDSNWVPKCERESFHPS
jgi:hypothetical protein